METELIKSSPQNKSKLELLNSYKKKTTKYQNTLTISGIILPTIITVLVACYPAAFSSLSWYVIALIITGITAFYLFLNYKEKAYRSKSETLEKGLYKDYEAIRTINSLVDRFTAVLDSVADATTSKEQRKKVYGIIVEGIENEIMRRLGDTFSLTVGLYRRCENEAKLIWHTKPPRRSSVGFLAYPDEVIKKENAVDYFFGDQLFKHKDDYLMLDRKGIDIKFDSLDKETRKKMKAYLGRVKCTQIDNLEIGYYVEVIVYDEKCRINEDFASDIICDIFDPMLDICRIVDCLYGGKNDG